MAEISCGGEYSVRCVCVDEDSKAAIAFPVDAKSLDEVREFAPTKCFDMLPGMNRGVIVINRNGKREVGFTIRRKQD